MNKVTLLLLFTALTTTPFSSCENKKTMSSYEKENIEAARRDSVNNEIKNQKRLEKLTTDLSITVTDIKPDRINEKEILKLKVTNNSNEEVDAFKGSVIINNKFLDNLGSFVFEINESIKPKQTKVYTVKTLCCLIPNNCLSFKIWDYKRKDVSCIVNLIKIIYIDGDYVDGTTTTIYATPM